jgi:predicted nucleic acid-binding Zn ribbon protein
MSTRRIKTPETLVKHTHCKNCGISVPFGKEYCSPECEIDYNKFKRRQQYQLIAIVAALIVVVVFVFVTR